MNLVSYDIFAPAWRSRGHADDEKAVEMLGRMWLRWTVYKDTAYPDGTRAWSRVSHHWTRRAAWRASSRLRFAEATP